MLGFLERWRRDVALKDWPPKFLIVNELARLGRVGVVDLIKLLNHTDDEIRRAAVETLGRIGPEARPALVMLIEMLKDAEQKAMHDEICDAIRDIRLDERNIDAAPVFLEMLQPDHNYLDADQLVGHLGSTVIPDLMGLVDDRKSKLWTRVLAARALRIIDDDAETAAPAVAALLESQEKELNVYLKVELVDVLARIGKNCPDAALAVAAEFPNIPESAGPALQAIGAPAIVLLSKLLTDDRADVRVAAVETLAEFDDETGAVGVNLVRAMKDPDPLVRAAAATALGEKRHRSSEAIVELLAALADSRLPVRVAAARSLSGYDLDSGRVVPALVSTLSDEYLSVRVSACRSLGAFGPLALESVSELKRVAAKDEFASGRIAAGDALRKIVPARE
jgi:HEAT repeat protein